MTGSDRQVRRWQRHGLVLVMALLLPAGAAWSLEPGTSLQSDRVMQALRDELVRCRSLKMGGLDSPYFVSATVGRIETYEVDATFGALARESHEAMGSVTVALRVGTPDLDSSGFMHGAFQFGGGLIPAEPDYDALRQSLWLRCDAAYKAAVEELAGKRAMMATTDVHDRPADFSGATVANVITEPGSLQISKDRWVDFVRRSSAVFRGSSLVQEGAAAFRALAMTEWIASSDPVQVRFGDTVLEVVLGAQGQAPDGQEVQLDYEARGRSEADLPSDEELMKAARDLRTQLDAVAAAPVLDEDYTGPVLFEGKAAATFFLATVADPLATSPIHAGVHRGGGFADRRGQHVATHLLTVRDDPTRTAWKGKTLLGYFPVDDDGVKPQPITLIDKGVLKTPYLGRVPARPGDTTNGHSRAGAGSVGSMFIEAAQTVSRAALRKKLIALAKAHDLPYALLIEDMPDSRGGMMRGGFLPPPSIARRVYVDGHEQLVRGATFKPASSRVLTDIDSLGNDPYLLNTMHGGQPVSVVAPSVLIGEMEVAKPGDASEKPPAISRPPLASP